VAAFCVHIIKNAAKTTSKGKQSGREMAKDRGGICGKRGVDMDRYTRQLGGGCANRQSEQMQTGFCSFCQVLAQKICLAIRNIHG